MNIQKINIDGFVPLDFFLKLKAEKVSFLHTAKEEGDERWSIVAWDPQETIYTFEDLKRRTHERRKNCEWAIPFCGGALGYFAYDGDPAMHLNIYDHFLCFNAQTGELYTSDPDRVLELWNSPLPSMDPGPYHLKLESTFPRDAYDRAFEKIQQYIREGDIYQINLTQTFTASFAGDPKALFARLCQVNPAPFAAYLDCGDTTVLSASPERFLCLNGRRLFTSPVKGTRPRGQTPEEDEALKNELMASEKEASELNMITDLLRNDLGQVSEVGSVAVKAHRALQVCPTVFHTYSIVEGRLREDLDGADALKACLPGGSVTGCPKLRACEIIREVEAGPRGIYTGAIGYLSDCGRMDTSIVIRTLVSKNGQVSLGVGGGIVADSDCDKEYQETLDKARSFFQL